jgi:uncharacterized protein YndB with AHSA1/START domain
VSQTITPADIRRSFTVRATPEKAFAVFTEGFDRWWPRTHSVGDAPLKRATIEPRAGGRWYSLTEDGIEHDWGDVLAWEPPARLLLAWRLNAEFAYDPALTTEVEVRFTDAGGGETRVDFEHRGLERFGAGDAANRVRSGMDAGWETILESFKAALRG